MRNIEFKDINNQPCRLVIHSAVDDNTGVLAQDSVIVTTEQTGYVKDIVSSSSLEFTLIAQYDGQYRDLYTTDKQGIKVELFVNNVCEFVGYLDSELYEEDYNTASNYPILFKAGNIKILKRIDFDLFGRNKVIDIITHILNKLGLQVDYNSGIRSGVTLSKNYYVDCSIFHDEFEHKDCYFVLESIMKSLLLTSVIKGDTLFISDIKTINYRPTINGADIIKGESVLSASECYNEVVITLDTGSAKELYTCDIDKFEIPYPYAEERTIYYKQGASSGDVGFIQQTSSAAMYEEIELISNCAVCRNSPRYSGGDDIYIRANNVVKYDQLRPNNNLLFRSKPLKINTLASTEWRLNIKLESLLSIRTNPFNGVAEGDCDPKTKWYQNHENDFNNHTNYTYIYANIFLKDDNGNITHYLDNTTDIQTDARPARWVSGSATHKFKFAYYTNMKNESGYGNGWQGNSPTVNARGSDANYSQLTKHHQGKGTLAELPPTHGNITIEIYEGVACWDGASGGSQTQVYSDFKHLWFKGLELSVCDPNGLGDYSESEYQYDAELDNQAADKLEIDNIIGCIRDDDYSCRGGYLLINNRFATAYTFIDNTADYLEIQVLKAINEIYKLPRYRMCVKTNVNTLSNIYIKDNLNKTFFVCGYEYNVTRSESELYLREIIPLP